MELQKEREQMKIIEAEERMKKMGKRFKKTAAKGVSDKHKVRVIWKWGVSFYIIAWSFTFASIISFFYNLKTD